MSGLIEVIDRYVDREGVVEPVEQWSKEDLLALINAAEAELTRRATHTSNCCETEGHK